MAFVPPLDATPDEVRALLAPLRNSISVAIYNAQNPFAVGAIIRVAHSFLVREIFIIGDAPYYEKASMGMHHYENIVRIGGIVPFVAATRGRPLWGVEKDHATVSLYEVDRYPPGVVFVLGSERFGLPDELVEECERVVGIPMYGINHSFPVTVAAGMVLSDWARRRYAPGTLVVPHPGGTDEPR